MTASTAGSDSEGGSGVSAERRGSGSQSGEDKRIREVWASNLEEEFCELRKMIETYPLVAMDTEFPGVVARPIGEFKSREDYQYQLLRCNVDLLRLIQVGITFYDEEGRLPEPTSTWQFNFRFNLGADMYAQDSVELLQNSGIDFRRLGAEGIDVADFAELLMTSGLVLSEDVTWLSFHSGYDFGYLIKLLTNTKLSKDQNDFTHLLSLFFPNIYDIKNVIHHMSPASQAQLSGGLQEIADTLGVERIGRSHQAGSDSLLTGSTFFKIKANYFSDDWEQLKPFRQSLFGLHAAPSDPRPLTNSQAHSQSGPSLYDPSRNGIITANNGVNVPPGSLSE